MFHFPELIRVAALLGASIITGAAAYAAAASDARVAASALESMARQPEIKDTLFTTMLIGMGLVDAVPIIGIVIAFIVLFSK